MDILKTTYCTICMVLLQLITPEDGGSPYWQHIPGYFDHPAQPFLAAGTDTIKWVPCITCMGTRYHRFDVQVHLMICAQCGTARNVPTALDDVNDCPYHGLYNAGSGCPECAAARHEAEQAPEIRTTP